ncbi:hypothetical protein BH23THE1_BH23THE1_22040 [soil metagenome]
MVVILVSLILDLTTSISIFSDQKIALAYSLVKPELSKVSTNKNISLVSYDKQVNADTIMPGCNKSTKGSKEIDYPKHDYGRNQNQPHLSSSDRDFVEKGVWLYADSFISIDPFKLINVLLAKDFNTIYFAGTDTADWQSPEKLELYSNFICYAYSKGMDIFAVTLEDPSFAFSDEIHIKNEFGSFVNLTRQFFDTYMIDVEPHTLRYSDPMVFVPQYIRMSLVLQEISKHLGVTYIDTVPFWYHFVIKNIGISSGLDILGGDRVNLMDYTFTSKRALENLNGVVSQINKPFSISIKVTPGYGDPFLSNGELEKTVKQFQNLSMPYGLFEGQYFFFRDGLVAGDYQTR